MSSDKPVIEERIYIGNVDFKSTVDELKDLFKDCNVTDVEIPTKTLAHNPENPIIRQLGFAFAQFPTKEDADKAMSQYNGEKFKKRVLFIKKALPPPTPEEKEARNEVYKAKKEAYLAKKAEKESKAEKSTEKSSANDENAKVPEGNPSEDTIFITNLDYRVNVKTLNSIFKDLKPKWIHVPIKKVPYHMLKSQKNRRIMNKGIAFIKLPNHETQKQAVAEFNGKEVNGRPIIVDIAIDTRIPKDAETAETAEENQTETSE